MEALFEAFAQLFIALWDLTTIGARLVLPYLPIVAWVVYWLFAVDWVKMRHVLLSGGWVGLVLIGLVMVLVWGVVAPPEMGQHHFFGLRVSNFVGKAIYVTTLFCIMLLSGSVQLSGILGNCCRVAVEPDPEPELHVVHH